MWNAWQFAKHFINGHVFHFVFIASISFKNSFISQCIVFIKLPSQCHGNAEGAFPSWLLLIAFPFTLAPASASIDSELSAGTKCFHVHLFHPLEQLQCQYHHFRFIVRTQKFERIEGPTEQWGLLPCASGSLAS